MKAEFFRDAEADRVVGSARWDAGTTTLDANDRSIRAALERVFRPSSVSVEDPAAQDSAATGPGVVEPGDLTWFRTAALVRGRAEGLRVRFVTDTPGGWDPAGAYRPLEAWVTAREGKEPPRTLGTSRA